MNDIEYGQYILSGFLECLKRPGEVKGFDKTAFKEDMEKIIEAFLHQAAWTHALRNISTPLSYKFLKAFEENLWCFRNLKCFPGLIPKKP